jgi:membrane protease YdiL (CAAX protease family)
MLGITVLITAIPLSPPSVQVGASAGVALLAAVAWFTRCQSALPVGVFCVVSLVLALAGVSYSQLVLGVGLLVYAVIIRRVAWLRRAPNWVRWGSFGSDVKALTAASALVAAIAVWGWYQLLEPNIDDIVRTFVPAAPLGILIAGGLLYSMVNAVVEEGAYRGALLQGLDSALGRGFAALVL